LWPPGRDRFDVTSDAGITPLSIGAVLGDADAYNTAWKRQIMALSQQLEAVREDVRSPISVNVIFHVDGRLIPNDFEGLRKGPAARQGRSVQRRRRVPKHVSADQPEILINLLREAVSAAERAGRKKGIAESLPELHSLVENLGSEP
jgi:hypothetical protein